MLHSEVKQRFQSPKVLIRMFFILLFVLSHRISAYDLYSELQYLDGSCHPLDTCEESRNEDEDHLWGNFTCECGEHCLRYGTCCSDSPHHGKILHVEYRGECCQKLVSEDWVIAVSRCSDEWRYDFQTRENCERAEESEEDPLMVSPVTSLTTHVTYKNYFCALCNYDTRNLSVWNIDLKLTSQSIPSLPVTDDFLLKNIVHEDNKWGVFLDGKFSKLKLRYELPPSIRKFVKKCYQKTVTQCNSSYAYNYELQYKCLSYYSPINLSEKRRPAIYRNVHCAMCNSVNVSSVSVVKRCKLTAPPGGRPPGAKPPFSFALLLDVNMKDGDLVGKKQLCDDGSMWDPFFKKCRTLACALPGYVVKNGQCVES